MPRTHARIAVIASSETIPGFGLENLLAQSRLQVTAVWNSCPDFAESIAAELQARPMFSLNAMLQRADVEGVVVLNPGWTGWQTMHFACLHRRPALLLSSRLADRLYFDERTVARLVQEAADSNVLMMPGLLFRWLPATIRLRELCATSLGAIEHLTVFGDTVSLSSRYLADLVDWSCNVVQSAPHSIQATREQEGHGLSTLAVVINFRRKQVDRSPVQARIQLRLGLSSARDAPLLQAEVHCRHGSFRIHDERNIDWSLEHRTQQETLGHDRSELDIALDLFGRRVVGGVVPVPDLGDVHRSLQLVSAVGESLDQEREIELGHP